MTRPAHGGDRRISPVLVALADNLIHWLLLVGDLNLVDRSDDYGLLARAGLRDAYREVGWAFGATFPASGSWLPVPPLARIDYIWHTPDFVALRAWVGPDHLPVLAELAWR